MKNFSLKDETGKIYYGWYIVLTAAIICGLVYSGIVSVTGVFLLPVTASLKLPIGGYSFYMTIMSLTQIVTLLSISKFLTANETRAFFCQRRPWPWLWGAEFGGHSALTRFCIKPTAWALKAFGKAKRRENTRRQPVKKGKHACTM